MLRNIQQRPDKHYTVSVTPSENHSSWFSQNEWSGSNQKPNQQLPGNKLDYAYYLPYMANNRVHDYKGLVTALRLAVAHTTCKCVGYSINVNTWRPWNYYYDLTVYSTLPKNYLQNDLSLCALYLCLLVGAFPWQPCGGDRGNTGGVAYGSSDN